MPDPDTRTTLTRLLAERILILDGGMGTMLQEADLSADDFGGPDLEGCNEHLVLTRPDLIQRIHEAYYEAGADIVETNTFGATPIVLAEYDLEDQCRAINRAAAECAKKAAAACTTEDRPRFVAGSLGPTTKTLTVTGGTTFDVLHDGYREQTLGLLEGGVDLLLVETTQDTLNLKAASLGIRDAFAAHGTEVPVMLSATIEPMGTMLAGQGIEAWYTSIEHLDPFSVGMNCATGPEFMTDHLRTLAERATCPVSVYPNAGLPDPEGNYPESPSMLAEKVGRFADQGWVNIVGGCCGTTPEHIRAIADTLADKPPRVPRADPVPAVSGIEQLVIDPEMAPILVGERTNVIGSLKFKRLVESEQWEAAAEIGRAQVRKGAQVVDLCLTHTDRDEIPDIDAFYPKLNRKVKAPLMIDATDHEAIEAGLRHSQGKSIINSINLEDGEERFATVCPLIKKYGAAVVVGCIDEDPEHGMAVTQERKLEIAETSYRLLTEKYGIPARDILFDPLVFPCGTGDENYVGSAKETVEGVRLISERFPDTHTILGISNVSFGVPDAGREVLNSVFLYDCVQAGLTFAIVNTQGIERYPEISHKERELCRDLLYARKDDALEEFVAFYRGKPRKKEVSQKPEGPVEARLARYVVEGTKEWLIEDLDELVKTTPDPLDIINGPLMDGMAEVGRLFGANELIVAEVLQSAEVMKAAVTHLEPLMETKESSTKGKVILATVKGDVHDIGKNLVEIILSNNGYDVVDLGIKTPPDRLIEAYREHKPTIIGLSGLLVKSAQQMVITAEDLRNAGVDVPLIVGGAALSAKFTASKIQPQYGTQVVAYARDAMDGLSQLDALVKDPVAFLEANRAKQAKLSTTGKAPKPEDEGPVEVVPLSHDFPLPTPADHDRHVVRHADLADVFPWINPRMLYGKHLGLRGDLEKLLADGDKTATELHDLIESLKEAAIQDRLLDARAVWRFFPAQADGETLIVYDPQTYDPATYDPQDPATHPKELERFDFRRQSRSPGRCLADYCRPVDSGEMDSVALFAVTAGPGVRERAQQWKESGDYLKSHAIQALALETAEAYAERLHVDLRKAWGIEDDPSLTLRDLFQAKYRGIRVSFGYPACPDIEDQDKLWRLLRPEEVGIELTDGHMMDPEASVSALVFHHPEAKYFNVD